MKIEFKKEQLLKRRFSYSDQCNSGLVHCKYGFYIHRTKFPVSLGEIIRLAYEKGKEDGEQNIYRKVMKSLDT